MWTNSAWAKYARPAKRYATDLTDACDWLFWGVRGGAACGASKSRRIIHRLRRSAPSHCAGPPQIRPADDQIASLAQARTFVCAPPASGIRSALR